MWLYGPPAYVVSPVSKFCFQKNYNGAACVPLASWTRMAALGLSLLLAAAKARAEDTVPGLSLYGVPGHVEMPSAEALPDGTLAVSLNHHAGGVIRSNLVFQITPRITGVFRYSYFEDYLSGGRLSLYDRSFDFRYQIMAEDPDSWRPSLAFGLQDFGGTGVFGAEYLVASKHLADDRLLVSAGLGWGRFGSYGSFRNPLAVLSDRFEERPGREGMSDTGKIKVDRFFRGDAAAFLALDWRATEKLTLSLEYSSDAMTAEVERMDFDHRTPINIGLKYRLGDTGTLGASLLYGSTLALSFSSTLNPARPPAPSGHEAAPPAIGRGSAAAAASWGPQPDAAAQDSLAAALKAQGVTLDGVMIEGDTAVVAITNTGWPATAQAWGRSFRVLSRTLPPEIREIRLRSHIRDLPVSEMRLSREDLETLEYAPDGAWQAYVRANPQDAAGLPDPRMNREDRLSWGLSPYGQPAFFDPDSPLRLDVGAQLTAEWMPVRGLYISGGVRQKLAGNIGDASRRSDSVLPHVRSDLYLYYQNDDPAISWLTAEYFGRPGSNLYSRATVGLFEQMFGGVSGELLWAPVDRPYALGVELNYAAQRDVDGLFGFQDYDVLTGHVSGYLEMGNGFTGQLDVGRYLAGDWGGTLTVIRRFGNGFEVGGFMTLTDVSFDDFGEGAFDKGIILNVPLNWVIGMPAQREAGLVIRPIQRDGGARLSVRNRLYELTRDERNAASGARWGRFWR